MLKKSKSKLVYISIILILIFLSCGTIFINNSSNNKKVHAETTTLSVEDYTNSDNLINDSTKTINDYTSLYGTKGKIVENPDNTANLILSGSTDDDIVQIVPKLYFNTIGTNMHMGEEYGFFINTTQMDSCYFSTVMVFDIEVNLNLVETIDNIVINVSPLFQYNYAYLNANADNFTLSQNNYEVIVRYSITSDIVVVAPSTLSKEYVTNDVSVTYGNVDKYYLKDVAMGVALFNEQELNYGDANYNPTTDIGSYVTSYEYVFNGKTYENGEIIDMTEQENTDYFFTAYDTAMWVIGWLNIIPEFRLINDVASQLIALPSLIYSWYDELNGGAVYNETTTSIAYTADGEGKLNVASYYQNRDDQLANYKDENGQSTLIKAATIPFDAGIDGGVWYGVGDYASGYFKVNHSALNQAANYTRLVKDVTLKVMDVETGEIVMFGTNTSHANLREPVYKSVELEQLTNINLLPNGTNYFSFNATHKSNYSLTIPNASNVIVEVDGNTLTFNENVTNITLPAGDHEIIVKNISQTEKVFTSLTINPEVMASTETSKAFSLNASESYLLKITDLNLVKLLNTNNTNVLINGIYLDCACLNAYTTKGTISPASLLTHPFTLGNYYAVLTNTSTETQNVSFSLSEPTTLTESGAQTIAMQGSNYTYFKFMPTTSATYVITSSNYNNLQWIAYNSDNSLTNAGGTYYSLAYFEIGCNANTAYYIGVKNETTENIVFNAKATSNAYSWEVVGGTNTNLVTNSDTINLQRGYTYTINLRINGNVLATGVTYGYTNQDTAFGVYNIVTNGNQFTINSTTPVGGNGFFVFARVLNSDGTEHDVDWIVVVPEIGESLTFTSVTNAQDITFGFTSTRYINQFTYTLTDVSNNVSTYTYSISTYTNEQNTATISLLNTLLNLNSSTPQNYTLKIVSFGFLDGFNVQQTKTFNYGVGTINNLFAGGSGTEASPYTINCIRHLNNANNRSFYYQLSTSLSLGTISPYSAFRGTLNGNGHTISYNITTSANTGYFGLYAYNYGTIKNLVVNANIMVENATGNTVYSGLICAQNNGYLISCTTYGSTSNYRDASNNGGLVGRNEGIISSCTNYASVIGSGDMGGIAGSNYGGAANISSCINRGNVTYYYYSTSRSIGGIVGYQDNGNISGCTNYATITYGSASSSSRTLQPAMSQVLGTRNYGYVDGNTCSGSVNKGSLHTETWTEFLFIKKEHNQAALVSLTGQIGNDSGN